MEQPSRGVRPDRLPDSPGLRRKGLEVGLSGFVMLSFCCACVCLGLNARHVLDVKGS